MTAWLLMAPQVASAISITEEESLGKEFVRMVEHQYEVIKDPFIVAYINRLGRRILSAFPPQPFEYHFSVIKEDVYNAFAGPGGNVYFNSGLIIALDYEDELAGIMAHEIGHVDSRHISEQIERSKKINTAMLAGVVASIFLGGAGAATASSALGVGSLAAGQSATLAYSRQNEIEADKKGLKYMAESGFAKEAMLDALNVIRSKQWFGRESVPTYLMTHPALEDRLAYIGSVVDQSAHSDDWKSRPEVAFQIVRARLTALYSDPETALLQLQGDVKRNPEALIARYGLGLALMRKGDFAGAITNLTAAAQMQPAWPIIRGDLGVAYFLGGRYDEAQDVLQSAIDADPTDSAARLYLGRTLLQSGDLSAAVEQLDQAALESPEDSDAQWYLGEAYHRIGNTAQAHFHLGTAYVIRRNFSSARFHLEQALAAGLPTGQTEEAKKMLEELGGSRGKKKKP